MAAKILVAKKVTPRFTFAVPILVIISLVMAGESVRKTVGPRPVFACGVGAELEGKLEESDTLAVFEGKKIKLADDLLEGGGAKAVLAQTDPSERWIEVDLSDQYLRAWDGNRIFVETPVSTGLAQTPTPTGEFRIWIKLRATKMEGGEGRGYYYLPNVPYVMFFENPDVPGHLGYGLHGTYWHNDFGNPRSHGCVNLPTDIAEQIFAWASSSRENAGTRIVIHD